MWLCREEGASSAAEDVAVKQVVVNGPQAQRRAETEVEIMKIVAQANCSHLIRLVASAKVRPACVLHGGISPSCHFRSLVAGYVTSTIPLPALSCLSPLFLNGLTFRQGAVEYLMVQDYCPVSLFALMQQESTKPDGALAPSLVLKVVEDIAKGLAVLHGLGIVHRDVKPENILQRNNSWLLVDFGSAMKGTLSPTSEASRVEVSDDIATQTTLTYRAPEMLDLFRGLPIGPPSDIWALACTFYYALYLAHPFRDQGELAILNGKLQFPTTDKVGAVQMNALISTLMRHDPSERPLASEVVVLASKCALGIVERVILVTPRGGGEKMPPPPPQKTPRGVDKSPRSARLDLSEQSTPVKTTSNSANSSKPIVPAKPLSGLLPSATRRAPPSPPPAPVSSDKSARDHDDNDEDAQPTNDDFSSGATPAVNLAAAPAVQLPIHNREILEEAKAYLAEIKSSVDPEMWRMEISPECAFPHPRDVVIRSWQLATRNHGAVANNAVAKLCSLVHSHEKGGREFSIKGRVLDCLQMVSYLHLMLQSGSFMALASGQRTLSFLEDVVADNDNPQGQLVKTYALYLCDRLKHHVKHHVFEGNMSIGTYEMIMFLNRAKSGITTNAGSHFEQYLINGETIRDFLVLLGKAINLQALMLSFKQHSIIIPYIIPLVKGMVSLFCWLLIPSLTSFLFRDV